LHGAVGNQIVLRRAVQAPPLASESLNPRLRYPSPISDESALGVLSSFDLQGLWLLGKVLSVGDIFFSVIKRSGLGL
jgi:hypothetical protein